MENLKGAFYGFTQEVHTSLLLIACWPKPRLLIQSSVEFRCTLPHGRLVHVVSLHDQEVEEISFGPTGFFRRCIRNVLEAQNREGCLWLVSDPTQVT